MKDALQFIGIILIVFGFFAALIGFVAYMPTRTTNSYEGNNLACVTTKEKGWVESTTSCYYLKPFGEIK